MSDKYYGSVNMLGTAVATEYRGVRMAVVGGHGDLESNDRQVAQNLSEGLTDGVREAMHYSYELCKKRD